MSEWGNPLTWNGEHPSLNEIGGGGETRGSEPSKYPQEKKSNEIPPVAASERGGAQTGVEGRRRGNRRWREDSRTVWEGRPERVRAP